MNNFRVEKTVVTFIEAVTSCLVAYSCCCRLSAVARGTGSCRRSDVPSACLVVGGP